MTQGVPFQRLWPVVMLAACAQPPAPIAPSQAPVAAPAVAAPAVAAPAAPSEAEILARSHAVLDAYDRGDLAMLDEVLAPGFVRFENLHFTERDALLKELSGPPHPPSITRDWKEEHVYRRANDALFIGMAVEHETGNDSHGNREYDGWYTVSWIRDGGAWKAAQWSWQPHRTGVENAREMWNDTYRQAIGFDHKPNRLLVESVRGLRPGAALDVATGQGRNAIFLASQGWRVTGVDISDEGLRIAREAAAAQKLQLATVQADIDAYDLGVARWDLVTMIYAGNSTKTIERIKPAIKPGGRFVLEFFASVPGEPGGFAPGQLAKLFADGFEILRDETVDGVPDWAKDRAKLVRFVARKR
jgi:SAM-dependent methyltransferase